MAARPPLFPLNMSLPPSSMLCSNPFCRCGCVLNSPLADVHLLLSTISFTPYLHLFLLPLLHSFPLSLCSPFSPLSLLLSFLSFLLSPLFSLLSSLLSSLCPTATTADRHPPLSPLAVPHNPAAATQPTSAPHPHSEAHHSRRPPSPAARPRNDCSNSYTALTRQYWHRFRGTAAPSQFINTTTSATAVLN